MTPSFKCQARRGTLLEVADDGAVHQNGPFGNSLNAHSPDEPEHCEQQGEKAGNASDWMDKENACPK